MSSPLCEKAINEALAYGNALLKFISPNDLGITGSHQYGFYLPKSVWEMYTPNAPVKDTNSKHKVKIEWQDGRITNSVVTWYGQKTRSEYRLTRFGRDFPWLIADNVGDLLVLIPENIDKFFAYVFDLEEDITEIMAALGVQAFDNWAVYKNGAAAVEDENECLVREFNDFAASLTYFPPGDEFSRTTRAILDICRRRNISEMSKDDLLLECYQTEYRLFQRVERQICQKEIVRLFKDVDDFLKTASSIMNRRKSRAGRSLENHVDFILSDSKIPHEMQPRIDGKPDIVIPDTTSYNQASYPDDKLFIVGIKTTCKDRWRQVLNEGRRVSKKHILTLQPGISRNQLTEMHKAGVTLIVPKKLQKDYPPEHPIKLLDIEQFMEMVSKKLSK
jgi:EcoRII C terminal/Restriction endonuclease EcoRII, N-terminal